MLLRWSGRSKGTITLPGHPQGKLKIVTRQAATRCVRARGWHGLYFLCLYFTAEHGLRCYWHRPYRYCTVVSWLRFLRVSCRVVRASRYLLSFFFQLVRALSACRAIISAYIRIIFLRYTTTTTTTTRIYCYSHWQPLASMLDASLLLPSDLASLIARCQSVELHLFIAHKIIAGEPILLAEIISLSSARRTDESTVASASGCSKVDSTCDVAQPAPGPTGVLPCTPMVSTNPASASSPSKFAASLAARKSYVASTSAAAMAAIRAEEAATSPGAKTARPRSQATSGPEAVGARMQDMMLDCYTDEHRRSPGSYYTPRSEDEGQSSASLGGRLSWEGFSGKYCGRPEHSPAFLSGTAWLQSTFHPLKVPDEKRLGYAKAQPDAWKEAAKPRKPGGA